MKDDELRPILEKLLAEYAEGVGTSPEGAIRDVLTDLKHIADDAGIDFQDRVDAALAVAAVEEDDDEAEEEADRRHGTYGPEYQGEKF